MACIYYVRQFKDKDACFILLRRHTSGVASFYSSSVYYSKFIGYSDEDYQTLVEGTVPATAAQTVYEIDDYAEAVNGRRIKPVDWLDDSLPWPLQFRFHESGPNPEVWLVDVRSSLLIAACAETSFLELYKYARSLAAAIVPEAYMLKPPLRQEIIPRYETNTDNGSIPPRPTGWEYD